VLVGGCVAYHGTVDHHLGALAAASGRPADATGYLTAAIEQYERMGGAAGALADHPAIVVDKGLAPDLLVEEFVAGVLIAPLSWDERMAGTEDQAVSRAWSCRAPPADVALTGRARLARRPSSATSTSRSAASASSDPFWNSRRK
jgi:hypothetical protein